MGIAARSACPSISVLLKEDFNFLDVFGTMSAI